MIFTSILPLKLIITSIDNQHYTYIMISYVNLIIFTYIASIGFHIIFAVFNPPDAFAAIKFIKSIITYIANDNYNVYITSMYIFILFYILIGNILTTFSLLIIIITIAIVAILAGSIGSVVITLCAITIVLAGVCHLFIDFIYKCITEIHDMHNIEHDTHNIEHDTHNIEHV